MILIEKKTYFRNKNPNFSVSNSHRFPNPLPKFQKEGKPQYLGFTLQEIERLSHESLQFEQKNSFLNKSLN